MVVANAVLTDNTVLLHSVGDGQTDQERDDIMVPIAIADHTV